MAVHRDADADVDPLSRNGDDCLDERRDVARTQPGAKVTAPSRLLHGRGLRRANQDEIANGGWPLQFDKAPETERFARREIDAIATEPGDRDCTKKK